MKWNKIKKLNRIFYIIQIILTLSFIFFALIIIILGEKLSYTTIILLIGYVIICITLPIASKIGLLTLRNRVSVHLFRYDDSDLEFLMIKRAKLSDNWQCLTGALKKGESLLESAKRIIFEETGYIPALIFPVDIPQELYTENDEDEGDEFPPHLQELVKELKIHNFIARIDQPHDPVLNPAEPTDWKWCNFETAYKIIKWAVEKKTLRFVYNYLIKNPLK